MRRRIDKKVLATFVAVAPCVAVVQVATESTASARTCSNPGNYHVGWATNFYNGSQPETLEGISSVMTDRGGYVLCSGDATANNFSTAWTMVSGAAGDAYVQSGTMYRYGDPCVTEWAEQTPGAAYGFTDYYVPNACSANKNTNQYWQQMYFTGSTYVYRSNVNSTIIHQTSWDPLNYLNTPYFVAAMAETTYPQSDVPGTVSLPYDYNSLQVQSYFDDSWSDACGHANFGVDNFEDANFATDALSCDYTQTWTVIP